MNNPWITTEEIVERLIVDNSNALCHLKQLGRTLKLGASEIRYKLLQSPNIMNYLNKIIMDIKLHLIFLKYILFIDTAISECIQSHIT